MGRVRVPHGALQRAWKQSSFDRGDTADLKFGPHLVPRSARQQRFAAHAAASTVRHNCRVIVLAVKALLAPTFVVGASMTARRFGSWIGGVVGGLPVVAGPILLVYALIHGRIFAQHAAAGTLLGLLSLTAFVIIYGRLASRATRAPLSVIACEGLQGTLPRSLEAARGRTAG